jgi:hypothetical protein
MNGMVRRIGYWGSAIAVGLALAAGITWFSYRYLPPTTVKVGPWNADPAMGTGSSDIFVRARTALTILVAIRQTEFVYYFTSEDSAGRPLDHRCEYRLQGDRPQALWWSIVAYNRGGFIDANPSRRYSANANDMVGEQVDVRLASKGSGPNWLAAPTSGKINLVMRLYTPDATIRKDLTRATLPRIERGSCS